MKVLISIWAGIVTYGLLFAYLTGRTTCEATIGAPDLTRRGKCVTRVLPDLGPIPSRLTLSIDGDAWPTIPSSCMGSLLSLAS
jgi:hypothetical protein